VFLARRCRAALIRAAAQQMLAAGLVALAAVGARWQSTDTPNYKLRFLCTREPEARVRPCAQGHPPRALHEREGAPQPRAREGAH